jgi:hypothetical protein
LGAPGSSVEDFGSSRPASSFRSGSPDTANFPLSIYSPRRRPRETDAHGRRGSFSGSMEITHVPELRSDGSLIYNHRYNRRVRTSSIWSPHLRHDRRAIRTSVWEPPSVNWSTESGVFGRRNRQIVMFITGFIFPFCEFQNITTPLFHTAAPDDGIHSMAASRLSSLATKSHASHPRRPRPRHRKPG